MYKLYCKGADNVIASRLAIGTCQKTLQKTEEFIDGASKVGLRTLMVAMKVVTQKEVDQFLAACRQAEGDLESREEALQEVYSEFEAGLTLLGATAVEDKL